MSGPQLTWALALGAYVVLIVLLTQVCYRAMLGRGIEPIRAVYFNRKIVHMAGSGVASLAVPFVFQDFWYPMLGGMILGGFIHLTHVTGRRMYWFQTEENKNDVTFAVMWWLSLAFLWRVLEDPWLAILPALFLSFGDGITGVVRNLVVHRRSKHVAGSVFMLLVCLPIGWYVGGRADPSLAAWGALAGAAATVVERYEFGPIDDNVLIAMTTTAILLFGAWWSAPI